MKYKIIAAVIVLAVLGLGYSFGYSNGFKKSTKEHLKEGHDEVTEDQSSENIEQDKLMTEANEIVGLWQSLEDNKFFREFKQDSVTDYYEKKQTGTVGSWILFNKEKPLADFKGVIEDDTLYLALIFNEETLFFKVVMVDALHLDLIYLDRGGALSFIRVPELE